VTLKEATALHEVMAETASAVARQYRAAPTRLCQSPPVVVWQEALIGLP
jgi:hypothetical protein